ncbi:RidA family protein [Tepidiforma thermophila]|uniref:Enamine deaminase RidA (YjgF/YER057c/UK114 family) n=1 Tax=Tepidiforma thermophila (strain KCTC 52669 / CGMCC 1.13589 / G233) TaxID=2761530 RepID=A0A2A9HED0_TEPT2|nr:RidA family protein [Tepidiforma thermophila]PFG73355.1 enamine deaminase RidA (YjgF/YER057c/UK114 family) [Tepidiforma thermophila]
MAHEETPEHRLADLGIELPAVPPPAGLYAPAVRSGNQLYVSGQVPRAGDGSGVAAVGKLGHAITVEEGAALARTCALQALAVVRAELGSLDRVRRVVRVAGYVASAPGFTQHPAVINGASQLLLDVFGEAGRHARVAIGVAELPAGVPVEVEFLFEVE